MILLALAVAQTQADLNQRAGGDFATADAAMNVAYRATMAVARNKDAQPIIDPTRRTGPSFANVVRQSQRAWLAYRDAQCTAEGYQYFGGTAQGYAVVSCKTGLTRERTGRLKQMAADLSR